MKNKIKEALNSAEEIMKNIELGEISLSSISLKCLKLARLSAHKKAIRAFQYEGSGYPQDKYGLVVHEAFNLARFLNRVYLDKNSNGKLDEYMFPDSAAKLESSLETKKKLLEISSVSIERTHLPEIISKISDRIGRLKAGYYRYALQVYHRLKFGSIAEEIFNRLRKEVNQKLQDICPDALQKFVTAYENLKTREDENWANAVHTCRRILKDVANSLYPPSEEKVTARSGKKVKLDEEHYVLRLKEFIKSKSGSETFTKVVGSTLDHICNRIDSVYKSTTKGTHAKIEKEEAERFVIYTYLLIGDILSLEEEEGKSKSKETPSKK